MLAHQGGEPVEESFHGVLQRCGPGEQGLEEQEHHGEEDDRAPHRVQQHLVDALGARVRVGVLVTSGVEHGVHPPGQFGGPARGVEWWTIPVVPGRQQVAQLADADASVGDDGNHRHTESLAEGRHVEGSLTAAQLVGHGDDDGGRQMTWQHLGEQQQGTAQGGGVGDDDKGVRGAHLVHPAIQDVHDDLLVGGDGAQGVGAGQILDGEGVVVDPGDAFAARDRHAGIVAGLGVQTGELVEDGGLPAIGRADEGDAGGTVGGLLGGR